MKSKKELEEKIRLLAESQKLLENDGYEIEGEDLLPKIEIEIMNGKKLPLIQQIKHHELDSFMKRDDIVRGELFIDENTGDLYVVDKGDLETYWLRMGRIEKEKKKEEEKLEVFKYELEQNKNPFLN